MKRIVTSALLRDIDKGYSTLFNKGRGRVPGFAKRLCKTVQSTSAVQLYGWLRDLPQITEKKAETIRTRLATDGHSCRNKEFTGIIEVPRDAIEDDLYDTFGTTAEQFGQRAAQIPDLEFLAMLNDSFGAAKAFTGKAFFADDHKVGKTVFGNKGTKKLSAANFEAGIANIRGRLDGAGLPYFTLSKPDEIYLVVSPSYESAGEAIVKAATLPGGGVNSNYGKAKLEVIPGLSEHFWFIIDNGQVVSPFIFQDRVPVELTFANSLTDEAVFSDDVYRWKARLRCAVATGMPQFAYGSTGADPA